MHASLERARADAQTSFRPRYGGALVETVRYETPPPPGRAPSPPPRRTPWRSSGLRESWRGGGWRFPGEGSK